MGDEWWSGIPVTARDEKERFLPTRKSLLSRLRSWDDQDSWREFFDTYWRLIYDVATKSGLADAEAQDVVQETILAVAKQMPEFRYDPSRGQFKAWLRHIARCRITDHLRRHYRDPARGGAAPGEPEPGPGAEVDAAAADTLDALWDAEWEQHIMTHALERLRRRVRPEHFQIFELLVLQGWPASKVAKTLEVSLPQVYVTRHRLSAQLKKEVEILRAAEK